MNGNRRQFAVFELGLSREDSNDCFFHILWYLVIIIVLSELFIYYFFRKKQQFCQIYIKSAKARYC